MKTTTSIAINVCYGGFSLSEEATDLFNKKKNLKEGDEDYINPEYGYIRDFPRYDKDLIDVIEELGEKANGKHAEIAIEEIEGYQYRIREYDGNEDVETPATDRWEIIDTPETRKEFPEAFL